MKGIHGRVAIVTGASAGIGYGIAHVFAREGAKVVAANRNVEAGERVAREIRDAGGEAIFVPADISVKADNEKVAAAALETYGAIDILVHNAGVFWEAMLEEITEEDWDRCHNLNLKGALFATQAVLPAMKQQGRGRILFTSSITGPKTGMPGFAHYGATKGGVNGFIRNAAVELAKFGITVNGVEPGNILTEGLAQLGEEYLSKMTRAIPMGKLGSPEDIAYAMAFFASDEAGWITGQTLCVDGGQTLPESGVAD
ncbi:3-oxoacyl-(ACP) reductase [Capsulimonas corticalis]|uniref:3-oxoacyl-(ACP) reductase n=1 Tax=Capsulimonas corticalis TaxID=2219043 RepID=A0A402D1I6_9BACT|nr:SDR family oxidoreductase [Capsulimonas corticalis]BDI28652.1 3-oxoacyl-(ACP) reductase [Capsulimonas corticalis]